MLSQKVIELCHQAQTVSSELARDPTLAPGDIARKLYGEDRGDHDELLKHIHRPKASAEDLEQAYACGSWGNTRPSDLFLQVIMIQQVPRSRIE